jgi:hypothetical protein
MATDSTFGVKFQEEALVDLIDNRTPQIFEGKEISCYYW